MPTNPARPAVTEATLQSAERLMSRGHFVSLLFGPHPSWREIEERDLEAVGTLLMYRCEDREAVVAAAHAIGQVTDPATREDFAVARLGVPLLGGQVAARSVHRVITDQHGPHGYEALAAAIDTLWPPPDDAERATVPGHVGMGLGRMLNTPAGQLLEPWQDRAVHALIPAFQVQAGTDLRLTRLAMARCVSESVAHLLRHHTGIVVKMRHQVLTELCPANILPVCANMTADDPVEPRTPAAPPATTHAEVPGASPHGLLLDLLAHPPHGAGSPEQLKGLPAMFHGGPDLLEDPSQHETRRILAVAHLRRPGPATKDPLRGLHTGLVLLAGEIAARLLHRIVTDQHGPEGFDVLVDLADRLHPAGQSSRRRGGPMPEMQARRLLNGSLGQLLQPWQHLAVQAMTAQSRGMDPVACAAAVAARISPHVFAHREMIPAVRETVLDRYRCAPGDQLHTAEASPAPHPG